MVEGLSGVLWTYPTMTISEIGETPFLLVYRMEAVVPSKVSIKAACTDHVQPEDNEELMTLELNLLEEKKEVSRMQNWFYQQEVVRNYNERV